MQSTITLAIADDHHLFRKGLAAILGNYSEFEIICEAENGQELLDKIPRQLPDIVLMDVRMPLVDGMEATGRLRELYPSVKIIVLSVHSEEDIILHMIRLGAAAFLPKSIDVVELANAIKAVHVKGRYFTDQVTDALTKGLSQNHENENKQNGNLLSRREIEVVRLMASQFTNQEIADILHLSARTVEGHRKRIQDKIGAKNMAGIIVYAVKQGLID